MRIVFCSGKVYFDLLEARRNYGLHDVAIVRIEQLYPFPNEEYGAVIGKYQNARDVVWCQEEPQNQGAWYQIRHRCRAAVFKDQLLYSGRAPAAAPATGIAKMHAEQQPSWWMRHCVPIVPSNDAANTNSALGSTDCEEGLEFSDRICRNQDNEH